MCESFVCEKSKLGVREQCIDLENCEICPFYRNCGNCINGNCKFSRRIYKNANRNR